MSDSEEKQEIYIHGISASPGICIGKAYIVDQEGVDVVAKYAIGVANLNDEKNRFKSAVKRAMDELRAIIQNTPEELRQQTDILETHVVLLKDKMLYGRTLETIDRERVNAEWALKKVVADVQAVFAGMADAYFRERVADIRHVSDRIMRALVGAKSVNLAKIDKRVILVARDLSPAETSQIQLEKIKGFVTEYGGKASHTSIIARTLELPAVQGLEHATRLIHNDDLIVVDGTQGLVIVHPSEATLMACVERNERYQLEKSAMTRGSNLPAETLDGARIGVMGNIELPEEVFSVINYGGEGVGLYRSEFQYMGRPDFPSETELYDKYRDVVEVMSPRPVTIRTLDINGDKAIGAVNGSDEANPALGLRGIRWCLKNPGVFQSQLRAILRAAVHGNVRIMFPMIATYDELMEAKRHLAEASESLEKAGVPHKRDIETGILIEVPSAVLVADQLAGEVDFFSIGTNDLIQYSLAIDRGNKSVGHLFQPLDPAVIRLLKMVTDVARQKGVKLCMCGEMAAYPIHLPVLLGLGMDELSMHPQAIPAVKNMIRKLSLNESGSIITELIQMRSANEIYTRVVEAFGDLLNIEIAG